MKRCNFSALSEYFQKNFDRLLAQGVSCRTAFNSTFTLTVLSFRVSDAELRMTLMEYPVELSGKIPVGR